jgi:hypothetical protein
MDRWMHPATRRTRRRGSRFGPVERARDNPFAVQRVLEIRYRLPADLTWEDLLDRLAALRWRADGRTCQSSP